ncbi:GTPase Der [Maioricimonas rarisocia]|uniref:GTPase Der n=1 Tax=Maioricimonas rarisocia TaxID=2528026 RepID=A0A517Z3R1_9PLAN|nr:GTPase [Maioricimonas rarisocia]QDU37065.1 GTPase Der [Maioricimonas rarisocia]
MKLWQLAVLGTLLVIPLAVFAVLGIWALWQTGSLVWSWWIPPVFWGLGFLLARRWQARLYPAARNRIEPALHWTPQDEEAMKIVVRRQQAIDEVTPAQMTDPHFYLNIATELSLKIAQHYHPKTSDPVSSLTVVEILAAAHLALEDVERWAHRSLPASHMITVRQWRLLGRTPGWYRAARDVTWMASLYLNPANALRYLVTRFTMDPFSEELQTGVLGAFYSMFVRQVGYYCIEMNSGRLRGGADRYRAAMARLKPETASKPLPAHVDEDTSKKETREEDATVTVAVIGQVKAGKSSLINALLGENRAAVDVLPKTRDVQEYRLTWPDQQAELRLLDTAGYADAGASQEQLRAMYAAFERADLVLLVLDARSPAREPDRVVLETMQTWYRERKRLKPPPVVAVLTHIDGLSPVLEWSPPYDWVQPATPKAKSISEAAAYQIELFGERLDAVVPVCSDAAGDRVSGVNEELVPVMVTLLDQARASALLRTLHHEIRQERVRQLQNQALSVGRLILESARDFLSRELRR